MSLYKDIIPPNNWTNTSKDIKEFDVYKFVMNNYKDDETIFKVVKKDGEIKLLKKKDCDKVSKILASQIINNINKLGNDQVKIFAVLGASEESVILMLSSLLIGAHHCICFEDLSNQAIFQRIKIFEPDIIICTKKIMRNYSP